MLTIIKILFGFGLLVKLFHHSCHGLSVDMTLTWRYRVITFRVRPENELWPTLSMCGGLFITPLGGLLPCIFIRDAELNLPAYLHEVGHVSDIKLLCYPPLREALVPALKVLAYKVHMLPYCVKVWLDTLTPEVPVVVNDLDFELRADAYAVSVVGAAALRKSLIEVMANAIGCEVDEVDGILHTQIRRGNSSAEVFRARLDALA